jgi:hypothetical protein
MPVIETTISAFKSCRDIPARSRAASMARTPKSSAASSHAAFASPHVENGYLSSGNAKWRKSTGRGPAHLRELYDGALDNSRTWTALAYCNLSFLTGDALFGFDDVLDSEVRHPYLNALLHDLIGALSSIDFIQVVTGASGAPSFGIGPLPPSESGCKSALEAEERQRHNISSEFSGTDPTLPFAFVASDTNRSRLVSNNERLALWPLRPRTKSGTPE